MEGSETGTFFNRLYENIFKIPIQKPKCLVFVDLVWFCPVEDDIYTECPEPIKINPSTPASQLLPISTEGCTNLLDITN